MIWLRQCLMTQQLSSWHAKYFISHRYGTDMHPYLVNDQNRILKSNTKTLAQNAIYLKVTPFRSINAMEKLKEHTGPEIMRIN